MGERIVVVVVVVAEEEMRSLLKKKSILEFDCVRFALLLCWPAPGGAGGSCQLLL